MASTKVIVVALFLVAMLVAAEADFSCVDNCVERCSNGKNLDKCNSMCTLACKANEKAGVLAEESLSDHV